MRYVMKQSTVESTRNKAIAPATKTRPMTTTAKESAPPELSQYLMAVAADRDKQAFAKLFAWFGPKIKRIAAQKLNNDAAGFDITQETMTRVWRKAHLFVPEKGAATTWVYTVMRNVIFDAMRKNKTQQAESLSDDIWPIEEQISEESPFQDHLMTKQLGELVKKLPPNQQEALTAVYYKQLTHEELAKQLNIPVGTVKSRIRLAVTKLKQQLGANND
ncbi:sigma-70 family RNA polymerase sigma factor [Psychrosphaera haliotis]